MVQPNTMMNHISQIKKLGLKEVKDRDQSYSSELVVRLELSLKYALSLDSDGKILKNQKDLSHLGSASCGMHCLGRRFVPLIGWMTTPAYWDNY